MWNREDQEISVCPSTGRRRVKSINKQVSLTEQQFKSECDINNILRRYAKTGELSHVNRRRGSFQDFSEITDYQEMLHTVQRAQSAFMELDPVIRDRFRNDPAELIKFLQDPKNREEAVKLNLINPKTSNHDEQKQKTNDESKIKQQPTSTNNPPQNAAPNA